MAILEGHAGLGESTKLLAVSVEMLIGFRLSYGVSGLHSELVVYIIESTSLTNPSMVS